jgi:uncharacterized membrane protein YoaT (DUF817 family)
MPLVLSFLLIGFFIWVAENYSTYFGAWVYPHQRGGWRGVSLHILSSWFLLVIVSFILVADLKHVREKLRGRSAESLLPAEMDAIRQAG